MPSVIEEEPGAAKPVIGAEEVSFCVIQDPGIPLVFKLEEEESEKVAAHEDFLTTSAHRGQEEAISAVCRAIRRSRAGLKEARKPIRVLSSSWGRRVSGKPSWPEPWRGFCLIPKMP